MVATPRLIFLDVDGVLAMTGDYDRVFPSAGILPCPTTRDCLSLLNPERLERVARIAIRADAHIVISSAWRKNNLQHSALTRSLNRATRALEGPDARSRVVGATATHLIRGGLEHRGLEIADYVNTTPADTRYVILDDLAEAAAGVTRPTGLFLQTKEPDGIRAEEEAAAIAWLTLP